jgi:thiol-disulfide isomerase/thioredoxin
MKTQKQILLNTLLTGIILTFYTCKNQSDIAQLPDLQIKAGVAKVKGKLIDPTSKATSLIIKYQNPITVDESIIETKLESDGSFYFEVPVECSTVSAALETPEYTGVLIELSSNDTIVIDLKVNGNSVIISNNSNKNTFLTDNSDKKYYGVLGRYLEYWRNPAPVHELTPEEYAQYEMKEMESRMDFAMKGAKLSDKGKIFISNELKLLHLSGALLKYKERAELLYGNLKDQENLDDWTPEEPDINYYTFLKSFNLNNPQYLVNWRFPTVLQSILSAKALNIPLISETPVTDWLTQVKSTLSNLLGFDTGQFYDILAANAYSKQFNDELAPLSDKQKQNIKEYFGDGEIAKILWRKHEEILLLAERKSASIVNQTPDAPKEKLMEAIIAKYKNKAVLVDFWATWCGPCLDAMKRIDGIKNQMKDKDIVFVYITNGSSPQAEWNKKRQSIIGEHYYLTGEEWKIISGSNKYGFEGIPTYLIFDKNGELKKKITAYPGNDAMRTMIEELL